MSQDHLLSVTKIQLFACVIVTIESVSTFGVTFQTWLWDYKMTSYSLCRINCPVCDGQVGNFLSFDEEKKRKDGEGEDKLLEQSCKRPGPSWNPKLHTLKGKVMAIVPMIPEKNPLYNKGEKI